MSWASFRRWMLQTNRQGHGFDGGAQYLNVCHPAFGARGDFVVDDTTAWANALAAAATQEDAPAGNTGVALYAPPQCTFLISSALALGSNTVIQGGGMGSTILRLAGSSSANLLTVAGSVSKLIVRDLKLDGNATTGDCLNLASGATDLIFERCWFTNAAGYGMQQAGAGVRVTFKDCLFTDPATSGQDALVKGGATFQNCRFVRTGTLATIQVRLQGSDVAFLGCEWDGNGYATRGIYASHSTSPSRIRVEGCSLKNTGFALSAAAIQVDSGAGTASDWLIRGNAFVNCGAWTGGIGAGAVAFGRSTSGTPYNLNISGNAFDACGQAIWVDDSYRGVVVADNVVDSSSTPTNCANSGIEVHANDATITGNELYRPLRAGIYLGMGLGGAGTQGIHTAVVGNTVIDPQIVSGGSSTSGLVLSSSDVICLGNLIVGRGTPLAGSIGIEMNASAGSAGGNISDVAIRTNRIRGFATGISTAFSGFTITNVSIEDNDLLNNTAPFSANVETDISSGKAIKRNGGYVTEASGTGAIANGTTNVNVTHGLSYTPVAADIVLTPTNNPTNVAGTLYVLAISSTIITVACRADPGAGGATFSWSVRRN